MAKARPLDRCRRSAQSAGSSALGSSSPGFGDGCEGTDARKLALLGTLERRNILHFVGRDILSTFEMTQKEMEEVFRVADELEPIAKKRENTDILRDKTLAVLFYQSSTRTRLSFEGAMQRLGGGVIGFADPKSTRSGGKDSYKESLKDTIRVINMYADAIAVRHPQSGAAEEIAAHADIPVLNGGDGVNEHPTQALLDLYTMRHYFGSVDGLHVALIGDMTVRTMHSLPLALAKYPNTEVTCIHPDAADFQPEMKQKFEVLNFHYKRVESVEDVANTVDVFYLNGVRHPSAMSTLVEKPSETPRMYKVNSKTLERAKANAIVLHPLPRQDELPFEVDDSVHAKYYEQAYFGLVVRMALLALVLGKM